MSHQKRAQADTHLDVDVNILDYLFFMATRALLQEQVILLEEGVEENLSERPLRAVDTYISIFKCNHPTKKVPDNVKFRERLLKLTTLYGKRNVPCEVTPSKARLEDLRRRHRTRAEEFQDSSSDSSFQDSLFEDHVARDTRRPKPTFQNSEEAVSLADLVPLFIGVSAARSNLFPEDAVGIHQGWMELAGEFMLQAALQVLLEHGDGSGAKIREILSWGWRANPTQTWEDEESANQMFYDEEEQQELQAWTETRHKYMKMLSPKSSTDLAKHVKALSRRFPLNRFEERVLQFLEAMQLSQAPPLLSQMETGNVPGMSKKEVVELKKRVRIYF